jgi:hypothetical protein
MDRRDFLKGLGVGAAGLTLGNSLLAKQAEANVPIDDEELGPRWKNQETDECSGSFTADCVTLDLKDDDGNLHSSLLASKPHLTYTQNVYKYRWDEKPDSPTYYIGGRTTGILKIPRLVCTLTSWNHLIGEHMDPHWQRRHRHIDGEFAGKDKPVGDPPDFGYRMFQAYVASTDMVHMFGVNLITSELLPSGIRALTAECMGRPVIAENVVIMFQSMDLTWVNGKPVETKGTLLAHKPIKVVPGDTEPIDLRGMV